MSDPGGKDVGMPPAFPFGQLSGFDIESVCFSYDPANDTLYMGIQTHLDPNGNPFIFGDADGDRDPSSPGLQLQILLGNDQPDLGGGEFVTLAIDFDKDNIPDLVAGVPSGKSLLNFDVVQGKSPPDDDLLLAPLARFYGGDLPNVSAVNAHLPSGDKPHLEFSITGLAQVPGFGTLDFTNPDSFFQFYLTVGSLEDDGIAEDYFPNIDLYQKMKIGYLIDSDRDTVNDTLDRDNDNDTIPDLVEKNLAQFDTGGDGLLSLAEILASGLDADADGDIDANDGISWADTDGDGIPDYFDLDSDKDGLPDRLEAGGSKPRDSDNDGVFDFRETDSDRDGLLDGDEDKNKNGILDPGETDPTRYDTDGDGLCDQALIVEGCTGLEITHGTDPQNIDTDGDLLCDGFIVVSPCIGSEGNAKTDPLNADSDGDGFSDGLEIQAGRNPLFSDFLGPNIEPFIPFSETISPSLGGDLELTGDVRLQGAGCSFLPGQVGGGFVFWWVLLLIWFGIVPKVWGLNADPYRHSMDGLGFLSHDSVMTLPKREFSLGLSQHIAHNPVGFGSRASGRSLDSIVNYFYVWGLWGAYGVWKDIDVGIHFPVSLITQIEDLNSALEENRSSVGDIRLQAKWRFWKSFGLLAFIDVPSGESDDFFGEGELTGGLKLLAEKSFGLHEVGGHLGLLARDSDTIRALGSDLLKVGPEMLFGLGWRWPLSIREKWYLVSHLWGRSDFDSEATSPLEWDFGFQKRFKHFPLESTLGFGTGMDKGYGSPTYRLIFGLSYLPSLRDGRNGSVERTRSLPEGAQAKWVEREIVILKPIPFEIGKAKLLEGAHPILNDVARLLKRNQTVKKVRIDGHTDSDGSDFFNLRLSERRAQAVLDYLVQGGVDSSRLVAKGWGERQPAAPNDSPLGKLQNRRVEFHVIEVEK